MAKSVTENELALVYIRVSKASTEEGLSLDAQERTLRAQAEADGYLVEIIREDGKSAKNVRSRPALVGALERLNKGEASALYVTKLDRLARSLSDLLTIVSHADRKEWRLRILELNLDTRTAQGRLVLSMLGAVAEFERSLISSRVKNTHAERRAKGEVWGVTKGSKPLLDPVIRKRIKDLHLAGKSLREIGALLTQEGIPTARGGKWHAATIRHFLNSPSFNLV